MNRVGQIKFEDLKAFRATQRRRDDAALKLGVAWTQFRAVEQAHDAVVKETYEQEQVLIRNALAKIGVDFDDGEHTLNYATGEVYRR